MNQSDFFASAAKVGVSLEHAAGKLEFKLTNDYLFRVTLQKNPKALKGLICSVLGLKPTEIISIEIMNPIELGKSIESKDFILDMKILLNSDIVVNLEMQILNLGNWTERSLAYLSRSYDDLRSGQDYMEVRPVIQVCFLDFTLFKEYPEFCSTYMFMNIKNYVVYSDKLKILVVDLTQIDKATEEEKKNGLDQWAQLFKADTWEDIKMLTAKNEYLKEAAETVYKLSTEDNIRMQMQAREDFYRQQKYIQYRLEKAEQIEQRAEEIQRNYEEIQKQSEEIQKQSEEIQKQSEEVQRKSEEIKKEYEEAQRKSEEIKKENEEFKKKLDEKEEEILRLKRMLEESRISY